jgi:hypothetical protein
MKSSGSEVVLEGVLRLLGVDFFRPLATQASY